jgi:hypothetical protein
MTISPEVSLPVAVIVGRRFVAGKGWRVPSWRVVGVISGANLAVHDARGTRVHSDDAEEQFLWGGLHVDLYRDAAGTYWENLTGRQPSLYVLCTETDGPDVVPKLVTADQHEACAGLEADDQVFAARIPPDIYQRLEEFIIAHHQPSEPRRRKRTDWQGDDKS